jgi:hypothetical protein
MNKSKLIAIIALGAIMSVAVIVASIEQPAMAITQNRNGASHNSSHGTNANGASGGGIGASGGVGQDAQKGGVGENGGTNTMGIGGCGSTCGT